MIEVNVPGWRMLSLENVLCDFNGTLATDGALEQGVGQRLEALAQQAHVVVLTADTHGTAHEALAGLPVEVRVIEPGQEAMAKRFALDEFGAMSTAFLGNGANDEKALAAAGVGIAVLGGEGACGASISAADMVVLRPVDALDLLLKPARLVAGLRR